MTDWIPFIICVVLVLTPWWMRQLNFKSRRFFSAAKAGRTEVIKKMLADGLNVNQPELFGQRTALMYAAKYGRNEAIQLLIDAGANVNAQSSFMNLTALQVDGYEPTALQCAAAYGHLD